MSKIYENLLYRYKNRSYWIDDYGVKGVMLLNEKPFDVKTMFFEK